MQRKSKYIKTFEEFDSFTSHKNYGSYKEIPKAGDKVKKKKKYSLPPDTQNPYDQSQANSGAIARYPFGGI